MQQRRRISTSGLATRARTNPVLATLLVATLIATAAFGGNQVIRNTSDGFGEVLNETGSFASGSNVVVDDPAIAVQGADDEVARTVKEFSRDQPFSMFALQWYGEPELAAFVRAERADGSWSEWYEMPLLHGETASGKVGTEPVWIEPTTRVQVNMSNVDIVSEETYGTDDAADAQAAAPAEVEAPVEAEAPAAPASAPAVPAPAAPVPGASVDTGIAPLPSNYGDIAPVVDAHDHSHEGHDHADVVYTPLSTSPAQEIDTIFIDGNYQGGAINPTSTSGMPDYVPRSVWGGDIVRSCNVSDAGQTKGITVHHTAGSNNYSPAQSISRIRGYWSYHANNNGWCDLGYNALVDKYGTVYEGRQGGLENNVQGAHVGGFNSHTWAISAMGNYQTAQPSAAMLQSIGERAGWRAAHSGFDPEGSNSYYSGGFSTSKYPAGALVTQPNINSHQHFHNTACPGTNLYNRLDTVRSIASDRYDAINAGQVTDSTTSTTPTTPTTSNSNSGDNDESDNTVTATREPSPPQNQNGGIPSDLSNTLAQASSGDSSALLALGLSVGVVVLVLALENDMVPLPGEADSVGEIEIFETLTVSDVARFADQLSALSSDSELSQEYQALSELVGPVLGANVTGEISTGIGGPTGDLVTEQTGSPELGSLADALSSQATKELTFAIFENGFLLDSVEVGTRAIWGEIANAWLQQGMDLGPLGLPINEQYATGEGSKVRVDFQGGYISYDPATAQIDVQTS